MGSAKSKFWNICNNYQSKNVHTNLSSYDDQFCRFKRKFRLQAKYTYLDHRAYAESIIRAFA